MRTDAPAYAPVPIRIVADDGTTLTLPRAHLEEIRQDYPGHEYDMCDLPWLVDRNAVPVVRAVFILLPDEHGHLAHLHKPGSTDDPIYRSLFRRYQP